MTEEKINAEKERVVRMKYMVTPLFWFDPSPVKGNDYRITSLTVNNETATISYNGGNSEAEVQFEEIVRDLSKVSIDYSLDYSESPDEVVLNGTVEGITSLMREVVYVKKVLSGRSVSCVEIRCDIYDTPEDFDWRNNGCTALFYPSFTQDGVHDNELYVYFSLTSKYDASDTIETGPVYLEELKKFLEFKEHLSRV